MKVIVYTRPDNGVSVVSTPMQDSLLMIGEKDIPTGINFWIIDNSELPSRETRNFWKLENMGTPDGTGLSKEAFMKKYPNYTNPAVIE